jgi:hypothetical protein
LLFKRAHVEAAVSYAVKARPTLIEERRRSKVRIAGIKGWAAR